MSAQNNIKNVDTVNVYNTKYDKLNDSIKIVNVKFDDLIKSPEKYKRKYVRVTGFLHLDLPYCLFYESEKDYRNQRKDNIILFMMHKEDSYLLSKKFNDKVTIVSGIFEIIESDLFKNMIYQIQNVDIIK